MGDDKSGWGFPGLAKKAHYFIGMRSLCRKWMYGGALEPDNGPSPDDCKECRKSLESGLGLSRVKLSSMTSEEVIARNTALGIDLEEGSIQ